ncbi:glycosyltransferase [Moellerella wisconsensis]|uniref:glycosyltransferase family 2 protein n=1 Tax=Moellerella wisconsensis TaxID=158849 RepID=UPI0030766C34
MNTKVIVFTVYYNRENDVDDSIISLLNQTYENYSIVAIDDGSTDSTPEKLKKYINHPKFNLITKKNSGFVDSLIQAINSFDSEYIAIHGSGDISLPDRLEKQVSILVDNQHIGLVGCFYENHDLIRDTLQQYNKYQETIESPSQYLLKENFLTQGEVMFRRTIYNNVGGYNRLYTYSQDYDLWLRMSNITNFYIIPEVLYKRFVRNDGVSGLIPKILAQQYLASFARHCFMVKINKPIAINLIEKPSDKKLKRRILKLIVRNFIIEKSINNINILRTYTKKEFTPMGYLVLSFFFIIMKFLLKFNKK